MPKSCNRRGPVAVSRLTMRGLAKLGLAALTIAQFVIVLAALLLLGATAIPSLARVRRR